MHTVSKFTTNLKAKEAAQNVGIMHNKEYV